MLNMINSDKIDEYIKNKVTVSVKMICKEFGVAPKIAHRLLKYNKNTMLDIPYNHGSLKFINYNLYRTLKEDELKKIISKELETIKKKYPTKESLDSFMNSNFNKLMMSRYRIAVDNYNL